MSITRDMASRSSASFSMVQASITSNTTTSGSGVDISGAASVVLRFAIGTRTDGTYTPNVQFSDDNSSWTSAEAYELVGSETALTASNGITSVGIKGNNLKKYVRGQFVSTSVTSGATSCFILVEEFTS